ncbi:MAG: M23 family metallopeptidase [Anaerolineae bacterium]|nr:M23 family metallopeptidase [Anaerolineae bacterium]
MLLLPILLSAPSHASERPFGLPFTVPSSVNTWLLEQHYGNTQEAFVYGKYWYAAGQGLHFGVDFEAPCGTPVAAVADGVVRWIDNSIFGAEPHNLVIQHDALGYVSVYGHLRVRSPLIVGQPVRRGDIVGEVGDPDRTCQSRPHLHLEIRALDYRTVYNPATLIEADWDRLAQLGRPIGIAFARDLSAPRRWQSILDQPVIQMGNAPLNNYVRAYPPTMRLAPTPYTPPYVRTPPVVAFEGVRLTEPDCCSGAWWQPNGELAYLAEPSEHFPLTLSPNGRYAFSNDNGRGILLDRLTHKRTPLLTRGTWLTFSPSGEQLLWHVRSGDYFPNAQPLTEIWLGDLNGEARLLRTWQGGEVYWLDEARLLLVEVTPRTQRHTLSVLHLSSGYLMLLGSFENLRRLSVAPGGGHVAFLLPFQARPQDSGVYILATQEGAQARKLPFVGSFRWQDSDNLLYLPYMSATPALHRYNIHSGRDLRLAGDANLLRIANDEWSVSPNGRQIALRSADDGALWLLNLLDTTF